MFHANNFPLNYKITFKEKYGNPECDKKHKKIAALLQRFYNFNSYFLIRVVHEFFFFGIVDFKF